MVSAHQALCCDARCGRGTPDTGPCIADSYGRKIAERAEAAGYVVEQGWQPIETAPRDGTRVLLAGCENGPNVDCGRWGNTKYSRRIKGYEQGWTRGPSDYGFNPTHWRPLPAPPTEPTR